MFLKWFCLGRFGWIRHEWSNWHRENTYFQVRTCKRCGYNQERGY